MFVSFPYLYVLVIIIPLLLLWLFSRYFIRLVKANESIADSLEEISQLLGDIADKSDGNKDAADKN